MPMPTMERQAQTITIIADRTADTYSDRTAQREQARQQEKAERERAAAKAAERERIAREQAEQERAKAAERERIAREQAEQEREKAAERERIAREHKRLLEAHLTYARDQWTAFQKLKHDAPPALLPLEACEELKSFREFLENETPRSLHPAALGRFESEIKSQAQEAETIVKSLQQELESGSLIAGLFKFMSRGFGKVRELLRKCVVSISAPDIGSPAREAIAQARKFLRRTWTGRLERGRQSIFSVYRSAGKTVVHAGSSSHGSVFITVPSSLEPEALAQALLSEIKKASSKLIARDSTIAVIDGDHQELNYKRIFTKNVVVRSVKDDCDRFARNLEALLEREPPSANNTALHFGVPANPVELSAVFPAGGADWDLWSGVAPLWQSRANRHGFAPPPSASAQQVLDSLARDKNVIVVVAHANQQTLYMPAPPPEGSRLSADQIIERKKEITANRPVVYLFCCETAEISNLKNLSETLLECGAAAVIAPQTKIDAERSADFFDGVVNRDTSTDQNSLTKMQAAERRSKYHEMEVWLG